MTAEHLYAWRAYHLERAKDVTLSFRQVEFHRQAAVDVQARINALHAGRKRGYSGSFDWKALCDRYQKNRWT